MTLQCANPACGIDFRIRTGRLFQLRDPRGNGAPLRHFWLCEACCKVYTVEWRESGITVQSRLEPLSTKGALNGPLKVKNGG